MIEYKVTPNMDAVRDMIKSLDVNTQYSWMPVKGRKVKLNFVYRQGHPAGYTDDLGIIADKNQWVEEERQGWLSHVDPQEYHAMREWCEQHFTHGSWYTGIYHIFIENEEDVAWFLLRWS